MNITKWTLEVGKLDWNSLKRKKENILLINDSVIGPFMNLNLILENIKFKKCDFLGYYLRRQGKKLPYSKLFYFFKKMFKQ